MMIYTILFLCIIRTDRLFLLSPDNAPEISSEAIEVVQWGQIIFLVIPYDYFIHARTFFTIGIS